MARPPHLGTDGSKGTYAPAYVRLRLASFEKDVRICLTATPLKATSRKTHAYFPALATCCAFLEHLTALYSGKTIKKLGHGDVAKFAQRFMRQPDYDAEVVRILFTAFRNPVAHLGIANGVWIDQSGGSERRLTWALHASTRFPVCEIVEERGNLVEQPPWPCRHTHRVQIRLGRFAIDLRHAAEHYAKALPSDPRLLGSFFKAMDRIYPR